MAVIQATIKGLRPILLHNPSGMAAPSTGKKVIPSAADEAKAGCYFTSDKSSLCLPSTNLYRAIIKAAGAFKVKKSNAAPIICGAIDIDPLEIPFNTLNYSIDTRRAVVQRQGILRSRPKIKEGWELSFTLLIEEQDLAPGMFPMLRNILEEAGRRIGIGDFRLEKKGPFGKFEVTKWEVI